MTTRHTMLARWSIVALLTALPATVHAQTVLLRYDASVPQAAYAAGRLDRALTERGFAVVAEQSAHAHRIDLVIDEGRLAKEAFAIVSADRATTVSGGDGTGLVYGSLALVEALRNGTSLDDVRAARGAPRCSAASNTTSPGTRTVRAWRSTSTTRPLERSRTGRRSST